MARFDDLSADQKAVLQLLLKQGKSYDDLAGLLRTTPDQVRERALMALDALGPDEDLPGLTDDQRDDLADFLLGQQSASGRATTRSFLERSADGRLYARTIATELRPVAGDALPDVPADAVETDEAFGALEARRAARREQASKSKLGGVLLLVGAGLGVALIVLLLVGAIGGGDDDDSQATGTTTTSTNAAQPTVEAQVNLTSPNEGSEALGVANVVSQGGQRALAVIAQGLTASPRYVVWLYTSPSRAEFLGFAPPVEGSGENRGRLQGLAPLPENWKDFKEVVVTRETGDQPRRPGTIVLRGPLSGGGASGGNAGGTATQPPATTTP